MTKIVNNYFDQAAQADLAQSNVLREAREAGHTVIEDTVIVNNIKPRPTPKDPANVKGQIKPSVYVASRASDPARPSMWKAFRAAGAIITSTWIDEAGPGETKNYRELWGRIEAEVHFSERLVLYIERQDLPMKGAYIETGMAMSLNLPIYVVTDFDPMTSEDGRKVIGSWVFHPSVTVFHDPLFERRERFMRYEVFQL